MQVLRGGECQSVSEGKVGVGGGKGGRDSDNTMKRSTRSMSHITIIHEENKRVTAQYQQKETGQGKT